MVDYKLERYSAIAGIVKKYFENRQVIIVGNNPTLAAVLSDKCGITDIKAISPEAGDDVNAVLNKKARKYYVVIDSMKGTTVARKIFMDMGYRKIKDFVFTVRDNIVIKPDSGDYSDEYGNIVHCKSCRVYLDGNAVNTIVNVDDSVVFGEGCSIRIKKGVGIKLNIGKDCSFKEKVMLTLIEDGEITIKSGVRVGHDTRITAGSGCNIKIGKDCLIAYECRIYSGDGHAIFDTVTKKRINSYEKNNPKNSIDIGDHNWICMRAIVMSRCSTGVSCIMGAGAVVKGNYPNNCVIAGNPSRIVRRNVVWTHGVTDTDLDVACPAEYIRITDEPD